MIKQRGQQRSFYLPFFSSQDQVNPDTYNLVRWQISKCVEYGSHPRSSDLRQDTGFVCSFWVRSSP